MFTDAFFLSLSLLFYQFRFSFWLSVLALIYSWFSQKKEPNYRKETKTPLRQHYYKNQTLSILTFVNTSFHFSTIYKISTYNDFSTFIVKQLQLPVNDTLRVASRVSNNIVTRLFKNSNTEIDICLKSPISYYLLIYLLLYHLQYHS